MSQSSNASTLNNYTKGDKHARLYKQYDIPVTVNNCDHDSLKELKDCLVKNICFYEKEVEEY